MPPRPTSDPDAAWLSTLTVLYVEDEKITRAALAEFLRRRVHRLVEAADGIEGLARFRAQQLVPREVVRELPRATRREPRGALGVHPPQRRVGLGGAPELLQQIEASGEPKALDPDTAANPGTWKAALRAAGAVR